MSKSKVKEYIAQVKRNDRTAAEALNQSGQTSDRLGTLEDLYGIDDLASQTSSTTKTELRKTLREMKEKDMLILKLREACHDLTLKYADAENTIDQLRFGTGGTLNSGAGRGYKAAGAGAGALVKSASAICLIGETAPDPAKKFEKHDQGTAMSPIPEPLKSFLETDKDEYNNSWSSYDVLDESCSNWIEKIQNWKTTDSLFNTSADADSGFRGSDIHTNNAAVNTNATGAGVGPGPSTSLHPAPGLVHPNATSGNTNTNSSSGSRNKFGAKGLSGHRPGLAPITAFSVDKNKTAVAAATTTATRGTNTEEMKNATNTNEDEAEIYVVHERRIRRHSRGSQCDPVEQFPEPNTNHRRVKSQSYDNLRAINQSRDAGEHDRRQHDPSARDFTPYYSKRLSMSNIGAAGRYYSETTTYFKSLDPLLDDATRLAKRVQYKSQKLARQLQQTLNESRSRRK